jgi:hypothetical protein
MPAKRLPHTCEIYTVRHQQRFSWKWRHRGVDGAVVESEAEYPLFFDCVLSARASGFEPRSLWTGALALLGK